MRALVFPIICVVTFFPMYCEDSSYQSWLDGDFRPFLEVESAAVTNVRTLQIQYVIGVSNSSAENLGNYSITDPDGNPISILLIRALEGSETAFRITVGADLILSGEYTLTIRNIEPLRVYQALPEGEPLTRTFNGIDAGDFVDTRPPVPLQPIASQLTDLTPRLLWTQIIGANRYLIEVSETEDMANLVHEADFPVSDLEELTTPEYTFTITQPGEYYWRVRADVSDIQEGLKVEAFAATDALHVYNDSTANEQIGLPQKPLRTITEAVQKALQEGISTVRVAHSGTSYNERVEIFTALNVLGGYDPNTWEQDPASNRTPLTSDRSPTLNVANAGSNFTPVIEGFDITSATNANAIGIMVSFAGDGYVIRNNRVTFGNCQGNCQGIALNQDANVTIENNEIIGIGNTVPDSSSIGITVQNANPIIRNNSITSGDATAGTSASGNYSGGFSIGNSSVLIEGNQVTCGDAGRISTAILAIDSNLTIRDNTLIGGESGFQSIAISLTNSRSTMIDSNTIQPGDSPTKEVYGVFLDSGDSIVLKNNIILPAENPAGRNTFGIYVTQKEDTDFIVTLSNNIISTTQVTGFDRGSVIEAVSWFGGRPVILNLTNNILYSTGTSTSYKCFFDNFFITPSTVPNALQNNAFVNCGDLHGASSGAGDNGFYDINIATLESSLNGDGSNASGNVTYTAGALGFVDLAGGDFRLTTASPDPLKFEGLDTRGNNCGDTNSDTCGNVDIDFDGNPRTCPTPGSDCISIGPFEFDN